MADLPTHPDTNDLSDKAPAGTRRRPRWGAIAGISAVAVFVIVLIVLHLTGVMGPTAH